METFKSIFYSIYYEKNSTDIVFDLGISIVLGVVSAYQISFDSTGVTSADVSINGQTYTIELMNVDSSRNVDISVTTS